jgi:hypothetical protein
MRRTVTLLACGALVLTACDRGGSERADEPFTNVPATASPSFQGGEAVAVSPTPPATPAASPETKGAPSATCERGWITPASGSPDFTDPLGVIRRTAPVKGDFVVVDMRLFVGPESPPSEDKGYLRDIRRWYVKLYVDGDWTYQGRFIVEQRRFGRGVAAVAPYDTEGFSSPDWSGFQWNSADTTPEAYPGLPGEWRGTRYDFVQGGAGLTIPGLPDAVRGCLDGT